MPAPLIPQVTYTVMQTGGVIWEANPQYTTNRCAAMAGIFSLPLLVAVSFLSRDKTRRLYPRTIIRGLIDAVMTWLLLAVLTGAVGMLVAALGLSGLGVKFSRFLVDLSGGNLLAALAMVGLGSLILGMS
ncbi:MAG TPA: TRAP transporter large permease subunit, partial [Terriglobales bacterium]|nr:TRAP transporter large permease subunit [Terriglobales bacterium]